jgi:serine/threonine-protein kinase
MDVTLCPDDGERLIVMRGDHLPEGTVIDDRYRINGMIGKGGMGAVYRAYQLLMDREVAFKVLKTDFVEDPMQVKRFFIEAKAASKLTHPNTITVFDFGQTKEGMLYMAMELVKGKSLSGLISEGPLEPARAVSIAGQIADSVGEAHSLGIIHRDLKPDNILIETKEWNPDFVKVLDFGIAKLLGGGEGTAVTKTGIVCGTPQYMSPEAITGHQVTPAADLYSLGIILYEMLSGSPPFQAETPMKLLLCHLNEQPKSLLNPGSAVQIPVQLDRFIMRVLSKNPESRPATARQFKEEMEAALREFGVRPATTSIRAMRTDSGVRSAAEDVDQSEKTQLDVAPAQPRTPAPRPATVAQAAPAGRQTSAAPSAGRATSAGTMGGMGTSSQASLSYDDLEAATGGGARKGLLFGAVGFAVVGLAVLAFVLLTRGGAPSPKDVPAPEQPAQVATEKPAEPPQQVAALAVPEVSPEPGRGVAQAKEEPKPEPQPEASPEPGRGVAAPPADITARLESAPAGAHVTLDGKQVCLTPCPLTFSPDRKGSLLAYTLHLDGYLDQVVPLTVGAQEVWSVNLQAAPRPVAQPKPVGKPKPKPKPKVDIDVEPGSF